MSGNLDGQQPADPRGSEDAPGPSQISESQAVPGNTLSSPIATQDAGQHANGKRETPTAPPSNVSIEHDLQLLSFTTEEIAQALYDAVERLIDRSQPRFLRATETAEIDRTLVTRRVAVELRMDSYTSEISQATVKDDSHSCARVPATERPILIPLVAARRGQHWSRFQVGSNRGYCRAITRRLNDALTSKLLRIQWERTFSGHDSALKLVDLAAQVPLLSPEDATSRIQQIQDKFKTEKDLRDAPNPIPILSLTKYLARRYLIWISAELPRGRLSTLTYSYTRELIGEERPNLTIDPTANRLTKLQARLRMWFNQPATSFNLEVGLPFEADSYHFSLSPEKEYFVSEQSLGLELPLSQSGNAEPERGSINPSLLALERTKALEQGISELKNNDGRFVEYRSRGRKASSAVELYLAGFHPTKPSRLTAWILLKEAPPGTTGTSLALALLVLTFVMAVTVIDWRLYRTIPNEQQDVIGAFIAATAILLSFATAAFPRGRQSQWRMPLLSRFSFLLCSIACALELLSPLALPPWSSMGIDDHIGYLVVFCVQFLLIAALVVVIVLLGRRRIRVGNEYWEEALGGRLRN